MKDACLNEFLEHMNIKEEDCIGYGFRVSDLEIGMEIMISPNFYFWNSKDEFTLQDAIKHKDINIRRYILTFDEVFTIVKIKKTNNKTGYPCIRVKSKRTDTEFNLIEGDNRIDPMPESSTIHLLILK